LWWHVVAVSLRLSVAWLRLAVALHLLWLTIPTHWLWLLAVIRLHAIARLAINWLLTKPCWLRMLPIHWLLAIRRLITIARGLLSINWLLGITWLLSISTYWCLSIASNRLLLLSITTDWLSVSCLWSTTISYLWLLLIPSLWLNMRSIARLLPITLGLTISTYRLGLLNLLTIQWLRLCGRWLNLCRSNLWLLSQAA
jgi:hypothetical protein